jgi:hypothetical protein
MAMWMGKKVPACHYAPPGRDRTACGREYGRLDVTGGMGVTRGWVTCKTCSSVIQKKHIVDPKDCYVRGATR